MLIPCLSAVLVAAKILSAGLVATTDSCLHLFFVAFLVATTESCVHRRIYFLSEVLVAARDSCVYLFFLQCLWLLVILLAHVIFSFCSACGY